MSKLDENKIIQELDEHYKNKLPECPNCKSQGDAIPYVYGIFHKPEMRKYAEAGRAKLMGCVVGRNDKNEMMVASCKKCNADIYGPNMII